MHVALKLAVSEDLRLARRRGRVENPQERRITGPVSHRVAHRLRARAGCVLVGRGTLVADRPQLTVRHVQAARQPGRAVLDSRLRLGPQDFALAEPGAPGWLVLTGPSPDAGPRRALEAAGHEVIPCQTTEAGQLDWEAVLETLQSRHLGPLWVEGGAEVASSLIAGSFVDRLYVFQAPGRLGGEGPAAPSPWPPPSLASYQRCRRGQDLEWILRRRDLPGPPGWTGKESEGD